MSQNKIIKFFISSTFIDFIKERNALQNFVFPRLKKLCEENNFSFQPVDLRWGVTDESSEDNKTMEYCLNEVKRCSSDPKPNLLILFGQRYGWGPLPSYIEPDIFDIISRKIDDIDFTKELLLEAKDKWLEDINKELVEEKKQKLQNEYNDALNYKFKNANLKMLLEEWYMQDLNDLDKRYYLKDKKNVNSLIWRFIEKTLKIYIQKVEETKDKKYYDNFHTSATEQEIKLALKKQEDIKSQNTIVYSRKFAEGTIDKDFIEENEIEKLDNLEKYLENNNLCTFIKKNPIELTTYKDLDNEYTPIEIESYKEENYPKEMPDYLKEFCESIYNEFKEKIETEIDTFNEKLSTPLKIELDEQERFLKSKYYKIDKHVFNNVIGRDNEVNNIVDFVTKSKNKEQYYLLYGKSGSGKTSVMAKALSDLKDKNSDFIALYRFIGTTANSTYSRQVFETLYWEIESILQNDKNIPKPNFEIEEREFKKQFKELLKKLDDKKVVVFLDAIDQFEDDNDLTIFLDELPSNFKIVFSVLFDENKSDNEDYTIYYNRLVNIKNIDNYKELDILDQNINIEILNSLLSKNNRTLSSDENNNQQAYVKEFIENQTPLCVKLTYEIVKEWTSTEQVNDLKEELPNIDSKNKEVELITKFFNNVIKKHYVKGELLNLTLGLISASKDGLSESELIDIISYEKEIVKSYDKNGRYQKLQRLPSSIFSKMYYHIQDIFTERLIDNILLINPYHRIVEETIEKLHYVESEKYFHIKEEKEYLEFHKKLSAYFYKQQDRNETWDKRYNSLRMLSELPYQLYNSKNSIQLKEILFDLEFAGSVYDNNKRESFRNVMSKATQLENITEDEIYPWESFYREKEHLILKVDEELWRPHQSLFQLAYEDGLDSSLTIEAENLLSNDKISFNWLKNLNLSNTYTRTGLITYIYEGFIVEIFHINDNYILIETKINTKIIKLVDFLNRKNNYFTLNKILDEKIIDLIPINNKIIIYTKNEISIWNFKGEMLSNTKYFKSILKISLLNINLYICTEKNIYKTSLDFQKIELLYNFNEEIQTAIFKENYVLTYGFAEFELFFIDKNLENKILLTNIETEAWEILNDDYLLILTWDEKVRSIINLWDLKRNEFIINDFIASNDSAKPIKGILKYNDKGFITYSFSGEIIFWDYSFNIINTIKKNESISFIKNINGFLFINIENSNYISIFDISNNRYFENINKFNYSMYNLSIINNYLIFSNSFSYEIYDNNNTMLFNDRLDISYKYYGNLNFQTYLNKFLFIYDSNENYFKLFKSENGSLIEIILKKENLFNYIHEGIDFNYYDLKIFDNKLIIYSEYSERLNMIEINNINFNKFIEDEFVSDCTKVIEKVFENKILLITKSNSVIFYNMNGDIICNYIFEHENDLRFISSTKDKCILYSSDGYFWIIDTQFNKKISSYNSEIYYFKLFDNFISIIFIDGSYLKTTTDFCELIYEPECFDTEKKFMNITENIIVEFSKENFNIRIHNFTKTNLYDSEIIGINLLDTFENIKLLLIEDYYIVLYKSKSLIEVFDSKGNKISKIPIITKLDIYKTFTVNSPIIDHLKNNSIICSNFNKYDIFQIYLSVC